MSRPTRTDYPGAWHHVMNRGARREPIFGEDEHVGSFFEAVATAVDRFQIEVHAYAVMPNHYHLLVRSVRGNLSAVMKLIGGRFTQEVNRLERWDGPVFRDRFRSQLVETEDYALTVAAYIHLNPVRARIIRRLDQRAPTSHRSYLGLDVPPRWLSREVITRLAGGQREFAAMVAELRAGARQWPEDFNLDTGFLSASPASERTVQPSRGLRDSEGRPDREPQAVLESVLEIADAREDELERSQHGPRGNPVRRFAAWALSRDTSLTRAEIGGRLRMSETHVTHTLRRIGNNPTEPLRGWIDRWEA